MPHSAFPADAISRGIALVTEDRKAQGLLLAQTVSDNIVLASLRKLCHMGVVDVNLQYFFAKQYVKEIGIKVPSLNAEVRSLSGGNQQKVVLAKWLMTEPKILILDEPSSALDPVSEAEMYKNITESCGDNTVIYISHRMSSAKAADHILFIENGCLAEEGSHTELIEKNGKYAELFRIQAQNYGVK